MKDNIENQAIRTLRDVFGKTGISPSIEVASPDSGWDLAVRLPASGHRLLFEVKRSASPAQLDYILSTLRSAARDGDSPGLLVAHLGPALLKACQDKNVSVVDLDGNAWIQALGIYIDRFRSPSRPRMPSTGTAFTAKASRIVRAFLAEYPRDWRQSELAESTGISAGFASRLVTRMVAQGYLSKRGRRFRLEAPDRLLDDWAAHYRFDRHRRHLHALSANSYPEGLRKLGAELKCAGVDFAFTGWSGAQLRAPHAAPAAYMAYIAAVPEKMKSIFPVHEGGNVILLMPHDEGVFQFLNSSEYGHVVSDAQLYVDLVRMPGRAPEQAEALRHQQLEFEAMAG